MFGLKQMANALGRWWRREPAPPRPVPLKDRSQVALSRPVPAGVTAQFAEAEPGGTQVDDILKKRIKELGEAINQSLSESETIADTIGRIKSEGYDVFLVLEATIGFTRQDEADTEEAEAQPEPVTRGARSAEPKFRMTPQDMKFLKSMKIALNE